MWTVPVELITVCQTDPVTILDTIECCEVLRHLYAYTDGHGAWIGRRLRLLPPPAHSSTPIARDVDGFTWTLVSSRTVANNNEETLDVEVMLKQYVYDEYWQQAQDDLRYRERCVNHVHVPSPDLFDHSSDDDLE